MNKDELKISLENFGKALDKADKYRKTTKDALRRAQMANKKSHDNFEILTFLVSNLQRLLLNNGEEEE